MDGLFFEIGVLRNCSCGYRGLHAPALFRVLELTALDTQNNFSKPLVVRPIYRIKWTLEHLSVLDEYPVLWSRLQCTKADRVLPNGLRCLPEEAYHLYQVSRGEIVKTRNLNEFSEPRSKSSIREREIHRFCNQFLMAWLVLVYNRSEV